MFVRALTTVFAAARNPLLACAGLYTNADDTVQCFQDFDTESNPPGYFCNGHTNATGRALTAKAADINQSAPDPYLTCALKCIALGCVWPTCRSARTRCCILRDIVSCSAFVLLTSSLIAGGSRPRCAVHSARLREHMHHLFMHTASV